MEGAKVQPTVNAGISSWKGPIKEDVVYYINEHLVLTNKKLKLKNNRDHYYDLEVTKNI